jgi:hypothetical protein
LWSRSTSATWSSKPAGERRTTGQNIGLGLKRSLKTLLSVSAGIILRLALGNTGRACVSGETARIFVEEYFSARMANWPLLASMERGPRPLHEAGN